MTDKATGLELRIPPLLLVLACAAGMWGIAWLAPGVAWRFRGQLALAAGLFIAGVLITGWAVMGFARADTTVNPTRPDTTRAVVTTGVYRLTRNPMYLGFLLWLVALAVYLGNVAAAAVPVLFVAWMNRFQITPEERALRAHFGASYEAYLRSVRRWL
jgi:protein-S-isoprenylcysteine O-methyltransferase Ste14